MGRWIVGSSLETQHLTTGRVSAERGARENRVVAPCIACCALISLCLSAAPSAACGAACGSLDRPALPASLSVLVQSTGGDLQVRNVEGPAGAPVALRIKYRESKSSNGSLFIFRGIPEGLKLNFGGDFGNFWAVNSKVFDRLTITAASDMTGSFAIKVTPAGGGQGDKKTETFFVTILVAGDGRRTQTAATPAFVAPPTQSRPAAPPPAPAEPNPANAALMDRAAHLLALGDIASARTLFEYLVNRGDADAAIALGGTYDQAVLGQLFVKGVSSDMSKARFWYEKAKEMGSSNANRRVQSITQR